MNAQDYPVTFPYGATDGVYYGKEAQGKPTYIGPYHRGDDRAMPVGTPIVINGLKIGLSGATGAASGPHLHTGKFESGVDVNPKSGGFDIPQPAHVQAIGQDDVNGRWVQIVDATAMLWAYLHLSAIYVVERQLIEKGQEMDELIETDDQARDVLVLGQHELPENITRESIDSIKGQSYKVVIPALRTNAKWVEQNNMLVAYPEMEKQLQNQTNGEFVEVAKASQALYVKK